MQTTKTQPPSPLIERLENRQLFSHFVVGAHLYSDATFAAKNWAVTPVETGGGGVASAVQEKKGGHPGPYRLITTSVTGSSGGSELYAFNSDLKATYIPAKSGAITALNYQEDSKLISGFGEGQASGPALEQDGQIYFLLDKAIDTPFDIWHHSKITNLTAADFSTLGTGAHPDFSQTADPIQFGFFRANSAGSSGYTITAGIDNWQISVKSRKQVK
jgi:hypothetical protein